MKPIKLIILSLFCGAICFGQQAGTWNYSTTPEGAKRLTAHAIASTPSGSRECSVKFSKGLGKKSTYTIIFCVKNVKDIKDFHFDDFDGPDAEVAGKPMKIDFVSVDKSYGFNFLPAGNYTVQPENGFEFSSYWLGKDNDLFKLVEKISTTSGKLHISISDSKDPKCTISAEFSIPKGEGGFKKIL